MNDLLKDYISKKEKERSETLEREKNEFLISEGLYEKVYSDKNTYGSEYQYEEWDEEQQKTRYYKKTAIEITDSEYEQILELSKAEAEKESNTIGTVLTVVAWIIFVVGFFTGIALGNVETGIYSSRTEFSFAAALTYWAISFISGIIVLGFAEIIKLLNDIKNK